MFFGRRRNCCGHGHKLRLRPRLATSRPRQGWSAGAPSGRAVRGGLGWQGAADGVATGVVIGRRARPYREAASPRGRGRLGAKMQAEGRRARLERAACKATIGRSRPPSTSGDESLVIGMPGTCRGPCQAAWHSGSGPACMWLCTPGRRAWLLGPKWRGRPARTLQRARAAQGGWHRSRISRANVPEGGRCWHLGLSHSENNQPGLAALQREQEDPRL